jgi:hypothetical protein
MARPPNSSGNANNLEEEKRQTSILKSFSLALSLSLLVHSSPNFLKNLKNSQSKNY